ncbi:PD-(D/E)XK nuclease family protein [Streptomyces spororaveus]|uniref:PD-(D/E)XK nuclease family protein n=1 Tax=Streptomyces spororaveus TaxID=284039 RepID=UPI0020798A52|nr:PD-(D/E)XK nuclease family protein [Streptomyces spororaveus]MCM9082402.1 PD-(D/E)XK nuclease family protein [Streptomyces spororaveus]
MTAFRKPPHSIGDSTLLRIGASLVRPDPAGCPLGRALRARALVKAPGRLPAKPVEDFSFKPFFALLDAVEHGGRSLVEAAADPANFRKCTPVHVAWAREAAHHYLTARTDREAAQGEAGQSPLLPVAPAWVAGSKKLAQPDARGVTQYERTVWGRGYASRDGRVREIWIPSLGTVKRDRPAVEIAAVAHVLLTGAPSLTPFGAPSAPLPGPHVRPERIRVIGVGLADGGTETLADWTAEETEHRYLRAEVAASMADLADATEARPSADCVRCVGLPDCVAVPRVPGLLGVAATPRKRRSLSVSDLRVYGKCAEQYHATRVLKLRDGRTESAAIRRGRAVDAWLNERHTDPARGSCRAVPLPEHLPGLTADEQYEALAMLHQHRAHCPFDGLADHETVEPQRRVVAYDPQADVVLVADCDLIRTDRGGVVVRETKTTTSSYTHAGGLMRQYPQLALAVVLVGGGILGGDALRSRIELEVLRPDGARLEELDPHDSRTVGRARALLRELVADWAADRGYQAAPSSGTDCRACDVHGWCATGRERTNTMDGAA